MIINMIKVLSKLNSKYFTQFRLKEKRNIMAITMLCRLYGQKNPQHFKLEWVPLLQEVVKKEKEQLGKNIVFQYPPFNKEVIGNSSNI